MPPLEKKDAAALIKKRHTEWVENQRHARFLADSLEGGIRYSHANYAIDPQLAFGSKLLTNQPNFTGNVDDLTGEQTGNVYGLTSIRNLQPFKRDKGTEGLDSYAMRLTMTPVPDILEHAVEEHLTKIYAREIKRSGPPAATVWWKDVDGTGLPIDAWMTETFAPLFCAVGFLDVLFDHPLLPKGMKPGDVQSRAHATELGIDRVVASIILPENMVNWTLDEARRYRECLVFDASDVDRVCWRHWTPEECNTYDGDGQAIKDECRPHAFGRPPIVRCFDRRLVRTANWGKSRYAAIASKMKAIYNTDSNRVLGDIHSGHCQLMMPQEYLQEETGIPTGPDAVLPMKALIGANGMVAGYAEAKYLDPPKGANQSLSDHMDYWHDGADRAAALTKPAGAAAGSTVAQSGFSKVLDEGPANALLGKLAKSLRRAETVMAEMALLVAADGAVNPADLDALKIEYPGQFDLRTLDEVAQVCDDIARISMGVGALPIVQTNLVQKLVIAALPGADEDTVAAMNAEVADFVKRQAAMPVPVDGNGNPVQPTGGNPQLQVVSNFADGNVAD